MSCRKIDLHQIRSHHSLLLLLLRGENLLCLLQKYLTKLLKRLQILEQNRHVPFFSFCQDRKCLVYFFCYNRKKIHGLYLTFWLFLFLLFLQDKAHCPFHLKTGACRFGVRCSRVHFYPDKSSTLLMKNMYNGPGLALEQDEGLEVCQRKFSNE